VLKSKTIKITLAVAIALGVLVGAGYLWLLKISYNSGQYYEAKVLADRVQGKFGSEAVDVFGAKKCTGEADCLEISVATLKSDAEVKHNVVDYVLTSCAGDISNRWPCERTKRGLLRKVKLYIYTYRNEPCLQKLEIDRNSGAAVLMKNCFTEK